MTPDWTLLQANLKETYWQHDKPKDTHEALIRLVKEAPSMDLNVYIIKFIAITDSLIAKHALSDLDRVGCLLDGLQPDLRSHVLTFCAKKSWRLSAHDTGTQEPDFGELKEFVLPEAKPAQKQTVYNSERAIREGSDLESYRIASVSAPAPVSSAIVTPIAAPIPPTSTNVTPTVSAAPAVAPDPIAELTKHTPSNSLPNRISRCIWCDSPDHLKRQCPDLPVAIKKGLIRYNNENRIINVCMGQEIPLMFNHGGMQVLLQA